MATKNSTGTSIVVAYQDNEDHYGGPTSAPYIVSAPASSLSFGSRTRLVPSSEAGIWAPVGLASRGSRYAVLLTATDPRRGFISVSTSLTSWTTRTEISWGHSGTWIMPCHLAWIEDGSSNGLLLATAYTGTSAATANGVLIAASHDNGATWERWARAGAGNAGWTESTICQLPSGTLLMLQRKDTGVNAATIHARWSSDYGKTWTAAIPVMPRASGMPTPTVLTSGAVVATVRDLAGPAHESWSLIVSHDGGQIWSKWPVSADWMMYGEIVQRNDGTLVLVGAHQHRDSTVRADTWARPLTAVTIEPN